MFMGEVPLYTRTCGGPSARHARFRAYTGTSLMKTHPPRTLLQACAWGPRGVLGGWVFSSGRRTPVWLQSVVVKWLQWQDDSIGVPRL